MVSLLLVIIYIAFISLGVPDSLLGSAWPVIHSEMNVPLSYAGILSMLICGCTVISSLFASRLIKKFGTGYVTAISVCLTAVAMLGFSISESYAALCLFSIPYGIGAGAVDAALNNYVALHYSSKHMSWLHAFWGIGVSLSPYIMSFAIKTSNWHNGYFYVSIIQIVFVIVLFLSIKLWKKEGDDGEVEANVLNLKQAVKIDGAILVFVGFFAYCSVESTFSLWATTYFTNIRMISAEKASAYGAVFFIGITLGRILNGFASEKYGSKTMIRVGITMLTAGIIMFTLPLKSNLLCIVGLGVIGLGCAPIYPCIIHRTSENFGAENLQSLVGIQMASGYIGSTFMPLLFGAVAQVTSVKLLPYYAIFFTLLMFVMLETLNKKVDNRKPISV